MAGGLKYRKRFLTLDVLTVFLKATPYVRV
jgi:hypothetical protein